VHEVGDIIKNKNKKTAQHVSNILMPIIRSLSVAVTGGYCS
jgi:hypothetical protein